MQVTLLLISSQNRSPGRPRDFSMNKQTHVKGRTLDLKCQLSATTLNPPFCTWGFFLAATGTKQEDEEMHSNKSSCETPTGIKHCAWPGR